MTGCRCGSVSIDTDRYKRLSCVQKMSFWMEAQNCNSCGGIATSPAQPIIPVTSPSSFNRFMGQEERP